VFSILLSDFQNQAWMFFGYFLFYSVTFWTENKKMIRNLVLDHGLSRYTLIIDIFCDNIPAFHVGTEILQNW